MKIVTRLICVGSVMLIGQLAHAANLVQNGSFEDGTYAGSYGEPLPVDWTFTPAADGQSDFFIGALGDGEWDLGIPAEDGSYYAAFGATGVDYDYLSETLSTVSGTNYSLSFWLNNQDSISGASSYFSAYWDGTDIGPDITPDSAEFGWTEFSYTVVGTGSDTLAFGGLNQPAWIALDNVVVTGAVGVPDQPAISYRNVELLLLDRRRPADVVNENPLGVGSGFAGVSSGDWVQNGVDNGFPSHLAESGIVAAGENEKCLPVRAERR